METEASEWQHMQQYSQEQKMRIMVALDESDGSFYALKWTLDNIVKVESAIITLVHVQHRSFQSIYPIGPAGAFYTPLALVEAEKKAQQEKATAILSRAVAMCDDNKIKAETLIFEGDAKDMICQATEEVHVDLLVVGSRGLGKIKRAFLGSVSDYCAHHAKCPTLIVRPPKESSSSIGGKQ